LDRSNEASAEARARILLRRQSVLDLVQDRIEQLRRLPLSAADRQKLDLHFTAVREVETRISGTGLACSDAGLEARAQAYQGKPELVVENAEYPAIADLQIDLFA